MEGLLSTAIGLSGQPKDYTAIAAARERQKGVDEERKRLAKQKKLEDTMKFVDIQPDKYIPAREQELRTLMADFVDQIIPTLEANDVAGAAKKKQDLQMKLANFNQEYQDLKTVFDNTRKGTHFTTYDANKFFSGNIDDIRRMSEENPDELFFNETGRIVPNYYQSYDTEKIYKEFAMALPVNQVSRTTETDQFGNVVNRFFYEGNPEDLKNLLARQFDSKANIKAGQTKRVREANPNISIQEATDLARQQFIEGGSEYLKRRDKQRVDRPKEGQRGLGEREAGAIEMQTSVLTYPANVSLTEKADVGSLTSKYGISLDTRDGNYKVDARTVSTQQLKSTTQTTEDTFDVFTGRKLKGDDIVRQTYSQHHVIPVFKNKKSSLDGRPVPKEIMQNQGALGDLVKSGQVEYIAVSIGENGIAVPTKTLKGGMFLSEAQSDKKYVTELLNTIDREVEKSNQSLRSTRPSQQTGGEKKQEQKGGGQEKVFTVDEWKKLSPIQRQAELKKGSTFK